MVNPTQEPKNPNKPLDYQSARDFVDDFLEHNAPDQVLWVTGEDLRELVLKDPNWIGKHATKEHPVVVTTYAHLYDCGLQSLSPFISFRGVEWDPTDYQHSCADVGANPDLEIATGTFHGRPWFNNSGVKEIDAENLVIFRVHPDQHMTSFAECARLKVARGRFPSGVDFSNSGIEEIDGNQKTGLIITGCDYRTALDISRCFDLKILRGLYPGKVNGDDSDIETLAYDDTDPENPEKNLIITGWDDTNIALTLMDCEKLKRVKIRVSARVILENSGVEQIDQAEFTDNPHAYLQLMGCKNLKRVPAHLLGHSTINARLEMTQNQIKKVRETLLMEKEARNALKTPGIEI